MSAKKSVKPKVIPEDMKDFINQSQFAKNSPKAKKTQKRVVSKNEPFEEEDISRLIGQYKASAKKMRIETEAEETKESREKILGFLNHQTEARKNCFNNMLNNLTDVTNQIEADYNAMKENEQKLEHLTTTYMKCIQQATTAYKHKLKMHKEIQAGFKKEYEELETNHRLETDKFVDEIEYDIKKLQEKLVAETRRSGWESLRRSFFHAMQNDF